MLKRADPIAAGRGMGWQSGSRGLEKVVDRHRPTGHGRLGLGDLPFAVDRRWGVGVAIAVYANYVLPEHVHVPNDLRACCEVFGTLCSQLTLRRPTVIPFAAHFDRKYGGAVEKLHPRVRADIVSDIWTERLAVRKLDDKRFIVAHSNPLLDLPRVSPKRNEEDRKSVV